ncbi:MAG: hypothetical protein KAX49_13040 [Halanaerobiales bacterium]|nr:hypothetical protein [Halanaerobiales bacterium]
MSHEKLEVMLDEYLTMHSREAQKQIIQYLKLNGLMNSVYDKAYNALVTYWSANAVKDSVVCGESIKKYFVIKKGFGREI